MKPNRILNPSLLQESFVLLVIMFFTSLAHAQEKAAAIDSIFNWTTPDDPGCICSVAQDGKTVLTRAYGLADLESRRPITAKTLFDIGSTHKQFVAAAILILAAEKKLALDDDVHKFFPELPDYGVKVTVDHLLTHTGGIRDWTGLLQLSDGKTAVLDLILRQRHLNFAPGEEWSYSNSGYVLLKEIVARVSGMSFGEFARRRIFEPLEMKSTTYSVDMRDTGVHRAMAYEQKGGQWKLSMRTDNDRGGGGVLSTAEDLLT